MDPLSIASAVITFWDAGMRLKSSLDKVGRIRQRTRGILEDILSLLLSMRDFCNTNESVLEGRALAELKASLDDLKMRLLRICDRCERILPSQSSGRLRRLSAGYALWRQSDEVEEDLLQLKDSMQAWFDRIHFIISARNELSIARMENETLVSLQSLRSHMKQLDELFCQLACSPGSQYWDCRVISIDDLDDVCHGYIQLKMTTICDVLMERPRVASIPPGTFASVLSLQKHVIGFSVDMPPPVFLLGLLVRRVSQTWQSMFAATSACFPIMSITELFSDLSYFGLGGLVIRCFECFSRDLRFTLQSNMESKGDSLRAELLMWLQFALRETLRVVGMDPSGTKAFIAPQEILKITRELQRLPTSSNEAFVTHQYISRAWLECAIIAHRQNHITAAMEYIQEFLDITMPRYQPGYPSISMGAEPVLDSIQDINKALLHTAILRQRSSASLSWAALIHATAGNYTLACCLGQDSIHLIDSLGQMANFLPPHFCLLEENRASLRFLLPTWINIPRNPDVQSHRQVTEINEEEELGNSEDSGYYIEWGIAM